MCEKPEPRHLVAIVGGVEFRLGPVFLLHEALRTAAWKWSSEARSPDLTDRFWFDDALPGEEEVWRDADFEHLAYADAVLLGLLERMETALHEVFRAVHERAAWEHEQTNAGSGQPQRRNK